MLSADQAAGSELLHLATAAAEHFTGGRFTSATLRAHGRLVGQAILTLDARSPRDRPVPPSLAVMEDYIRGHLSDSDLLPRVWDVAGCSRSTAERLFRAHTGRSIGAWIRDQRPDEARRLLTSTSMRVGEVARAVGYGDPLYFSRVFRAAMGMSPRNYGARARLM